MIKYIILFSLFFNFVSFSSAGNTRDSNSKILKNSDIVNGANLSISKEELTKIGEQIFKNEANSKPEKLVWWNYGENFPSMGIGHFIWYHKNYKGPFDEGMPKLKEYYIKQGIKLPRILAKNKYSPWKNRDEMEAQRDTKDFQELISFFNNTKDIQISHIYHDRLLTALNKILEKTNNKEHVKLQFNRMANSPNGLYPLIDYINFKGEGILESEKYNGVGWGLLQVLEEMQGDKKGQEALDEFSRGAIVVLTNRVNNSNPSRGEKRWLPGWIVRCKTYKNFK